MILESQKRWEEIQKQEKKKEILLGNIAYS